MSVPYSDPEYQCFRCGEFFTREQMSEEDGRLYCIPCEAEIVKEEL